MTKTTTMPAKAPAAASTDAGAVTAPTQFIKTRLEGTHSGRGAPRERPPRLSGASSLSLTPSRPPAAEPDPASGTEWPRSRGWSRVRRHRRDRRSSGRA